jgi:hypothetical protein
MCFRRPHVISKSTSVLGSGGGCGCARLCSSLDVHHRAPPELEAVLDLEYHLMILLLVTSNPLRGIRKPQPEASPSQ